MTEQQPIFKDPEKQDFKKIFLLLGVLLLAVLVWELYEEARGRQPWIGYQEEFQALELDELNKELREAKASYEGKQQKLTFAPIQAEPTNPGQFQKHLAEAEKLLHSAEYRQAAAEVGKLKQRLEEAKTQHQFMKADLDAVYYRYDMAVEEGKDSSKIGEELNAMKSKLKANEEATASLEGQLASASRKVVRYEDDLKAIKKQMDSQTADIVGIEERIEKIKARPAAINQIVVSGLGEYQKVDRCVTCHAGIDRKDFENASKLVFRAHPKHDELFKHHALDKIGCTACHDGQGRALTVREAHEGEEHWIAPMLEAKYVPSTCGRCHSDAPLLTEAASVARGAHIFQEKGCIACHKVDSSPYLLAEPARIGPELLKVKNKVKPDWLVTWIKYPKAIHPRTYMPHFGQKGVGLPDGEAKAIASYLVVSSLPFQPSANALAYQSSHVATPATIKAGEKLFSQRGCMGCHELGSYRALGPRHIALDGVANKLSQSWIYSWVENPKHYSDTTIMPKFPLAKEEISNVADFLSTLTKSETDVKYLTVSTDELSSTNNFLAGKKLVKKYGCYSCHKIPGYENQVEKIGPELTDFAAKDPQMLFWGNKNVVPVKERNWYTWTRARLDEPKSFETDRVEAVMPNLNLSSDETDKIMLFLRTLSSQKTVVKELRRELKPGEHELIAGTQLLHRYGCIGCHAMYDPGKVRLIAGFKKEPVATFGRIAPNISPEGERVHASWLADFLRSPYKMRPYLPATMPKFNFQGKDQDSVVAYFKASAKQPEYLGRVETPDISPVVAPKTGQNLLVNFQCVTCHQVGHKEIAAKNNIRWYRNMDEARKFAPDLVYSVQRLNPTWANKWIENPHSILPDTTMPFQAITREEASAIRSYLGTVSGQGVKLQSAKLEAGK